jgi:anti-sigma factor RsiW
VAKPCDYQNDLHSFLDGALDEHRHNQFEAHLVSCKSCQSAVETASGLKKLMQEAVPEDQISEIWTSIKDKLPSLCATIQADLSAYFDGELSSQAEAAVSSHVLKCSRCTKELERIRATGRLLARAFAVSVSSAIDLWSKLKLRLGEDCAMVAAELSAYADAQVDPLRHRAITAHLTDCSACSIEFRRISSLGEKLRSSYLPATDCADLWAGISEKFKVVPFRSRSRYDRLKNFLRLQPNSRRLIIVATAASVITFTGLGVTALFKLYESNSVKQVSAESYLLDSLLSDMSNTAEAIIYEDHG